MDDIFDILDILEALDVPVDDTDNDLYEDMDYDDFDFEKWILEV